MKNCFAFFLPALFLVLAKPAFSQENVCESGYMPFKEGVYFEQTHYDKKGKPASIVKQTITDIEQVDGGFKAIVDMETTDEKGKSLNKGNFGIECKNGTMHLDLSSMMNPQSMAGMKDMEMEMSGTALEIPKDLEPGATLPDGTMTMKANSGGMTLMTLNFNVTNRKVEGRESVTTPAGTFDCIKVSSDTEMKAIIKKKFRTTTWFAKGYGMVKTENYDEKGNVESSSLLTKFEKS